MSQSFSQYNFFIYTYKDFVLLNRMNLGMRLVCVCVVGGRWWVRVSAVAPVLLDQGIIFAEQISSIIEVYLTRIIELLKHVEPFDISSLKTMIFDHNIVYSHVNREQSYNLCDDKTKLNAGLKSYRDHVFH